MMFFPEDVMFNHVVQRNHFLMVIKINKQAPGFFIKINK